MFKEVFELSKVVNCKSLNTIIFNKITNLSIQTIVSEGKTTEEKIYFHTC